MPTRAQKGGALFYVYNPLPFGDPTVCTYDFHRWLTSGDMNSRVPHMVMGILSA